MSNGLGLTFVLLIFREVMNFRVTIFTRQLCMLFFGQFLVVVIGRVFRLMIFYIHVKNHSTLLIV